MSKSLVILIQKVAKVEAVGRDRQAIFGGVLGALYCFRKAAELSHRDRTGAQLPTDYERELKAVAAALARGREVSEREWLATLYFNSGVHRLHLSAERFDALHKRRARSGKGPRQGTPILAADSIKADVDKQKHEPQGLLEGRRADWPQVLRKFEALCHQLTENWKVDTAEGAG